MCAELHQLAECRRLEKRSIDAGHFLHHVLTSNDICRFTLLETSSGAGNEKPQETNRTAELNNQGLLQMQRSVMNEQDQELADLEATVGSTKVSTANSILPFSFVS